MYIYTKIHQYATGLVNGNRGNGSVLNWEEEFEDMWSPFKLVTLTAKEELSTLDAIKYLLSNCSAFMTLPSGT